MSDPGFWRRGISRRATIIIVVVCVAIVVGGLIYATASGIPLF